MLTSISIITTTLWREFVLLLLTFLFIITSFAQKTSGLVKGILIDSISSEPISDATISVIEEKVASFKSLALSSNKGSFEIKNLNSGTYTLVASYQGLKTIKKTFSISTEKNTVDFGILKMEKAYKILGEVIVKDMAPMKINGDTLVYKADAFKTKPKELCLY